MTVIPKAVKEVQNVEEGQEMNAANHCVHSSERGRLSGALDRQLGVIGETPWRS
jgi:hypothetical protein